MRLDQPVAELQAKDDRHASDLPATDAVEDSQVQTEPTILL
jgi:hypothetical protein